MSQLAGIREPLAPLAEGPLRDADVRMLLDADRWRLSVQAPTGYLDGPVEAATAVGSSGDGRAGLLVPWSPELQRALEGRRTFVLREEADLVEVAFELEGLAASQPLMLVVGRATATRVPTERLLTAPVSMPTRSGQTTVVGVSGDDGEEALVVVVGEPPAGCRTIIYVHRNCVLGDALGSRRCPRSRALRAAMERMRVEGGGVLVYLRDESSLLTCCVPNPAPPLPMSALVCAGISDVVRGLELGALELVALPADERQLRESGIEAEPVLEAG